jgi:hypothetical protein
MITVEFGESVDVGHLLRADVVYSRLTVVVVSNSSWTWYIACAQVGLSKVRCVSLSTVAAKHLEQLGQGNLSLLDSSNEVALEKAIEESCDVLLVEVVGDDVSWLPLADTDKRIMIIGPPSVRLAFHKKLGGVTWCQKITHRKLGGLTTAATVVVVWGGGCGSEVRLREARYPQ